MDVDGPGETSPDHTEEAPAYVPLGPADPGRVESFAALADLDGDHDPGPLTQAVEAVGVVPAVVAVIVTHDAGDWLEEVISAFAAQSYTNLEVLVIDAGSAIDPTPQIARVMPGAYVRRLDHNPGFGPALNEVLDLVEGANFLLLCHDDVAPEPDAVHLLVEEAFRSNAGMVGPKLVEWDNPDRILQVGLAADRTGAVSPYAERGELDQEQHDAVRDVFVVPGACVLVRADLFGHLGGFDPSIDLIGEDLDLAWRVHLAGARVIVAPEARVRHRESMSARRPDVDVNARAAQHRLQVVLGTAGRWSLPWTVIRTALLNAIDAILCAMSGRTDEARALAGAWVAAFGRLGAIRSMRKRVASTRQVSDSDVHDLQVRATARMLASLQTRRRRTERKARSGSAARPKAARDDWSLLVVWAVAALLFLGTRGLVFGHVPAIGDFARIHGGPADMLKAFASAWRGAGLGGEAPAPPIQGTFGALALLFAGAAGLARQLAILALIPVGAWGAWRLVRPLDSRRAQVASLIVYVSAPVGYNALSQGRWPALAVTAAAPWLVAALARSTGLAPFGARAEPGDGARPPLATATQPSWRTQALGLGLLVGILSVVFPAAGLVVAVIVVGLLIGSLLSGRAAGLGRLLGVSLGACLIGLALHLPWTLGWLGHGAQLASVLGPRAHPSEALSLAEVLRAETGPFGGTPLGYALLVAGLLPLLIGRGWRFAWAVRAWFVAVVCWAITWLGGAGWLMIPMPAPEVLLAPAMAALGLAAALGVAAFEVDLPAYRFGWRQIASAVTALAMVVASLPFIVTAFPGRWKVPAGDLADALPFVREARDKASFRVLWLGDPEVLPAGGWRLADHLSYSTTADGDADLAEVWGPAAPGRATVLGDEVTLATAGQTTRLGAALARHGVRYIVVPSRLVPTPYDSVDRPPPVRLLAALAAQLDLREVPTNPAVTVYENTAWTPQPKLVAADKARADEHSPARAGLLAATILLWLVTTALWWRGRRRLTRIPLDLGESQAPGLADHGMTVLAGGDAIDGPLRVGDGPGVPLRHVPETDSAGSAQEATIESASEVEP